MWVEGSVIKPACSWIRKSLNGDQHRQDNHPVVAKQLPTHFVTPAWMPFVILVLGAYKCLELRLLLHGQYNLIPISIVGLILWMILLNCNLVSFQNCRLLILLKVQTPLFIFSCWSRSRKGRVKLDVLCLISCKDLGDLYTGIILLDHMYAKWTIYGKVNHVPPGGIGREIQEAEMCFSVTGVTNWLIFDSC